MNEIKEYLQTVENYENMTPQEQQEEYDKIKAAYECKAREEAIRDWEDYRENIATDLASKIQSDIDADNRQGVAVSSHISSPMTDPRTLEVNFFHINSIQLCKSLFL